MKSSVEAQEHMEKVLERLAVWSTGSRQKESDDAPPPKSLTKEHMAPRSPLSLLVFALSYGTISGLLSSTEGLMISVKSLTFLAGLLQLHGIG